MLSCEGALSNKLLFRSHSLILCHILNYIFHFFYFTVENFNDLLDFIFKMNLRKLNKTIFHLVKPETETEAEAQRVHSTKTLFLNISSFFISESRK